VKCKGGVATFTYTGGLEKAVQQAKKELSEKESSQKRGFLKWQRDNAVKAFDTYEKRIRDLNEFIELARERLLEEEGGAE
jgi:hypothetical protein